MKEKKNTQPFENRLLRILLNSHINILKLGRGNPFKYIFCYEILIHNATEELLELKLILF